MANKSFKEFLGRDVKPIDRFLFAGGMLLATPLMAVITVLAMTGASGWLLYLAIRQIITKEEM